jgi:hypothetical protein
LHSAVGLLEEDAVLTEGEDNSTNGSIEKSKAKFSESMESEDVEVPRLRSNLSEIRHGFGLEDPESDTIEFKNGERILALNRIQKRSGH